VGKGGAKDIGFGAEDVAAIEPLLVTYNNTGEIEGVKYEKLSTVLVNAVKEQQAQIDAQQKQIKQQQAMIESLKSLLCEHNSDAEICK
jgi:D-hexose-6-phosphate mutarotase